MPALFGPSATRLMSYTPGAAPNGTDPPNTTTSLCPGARTITGGQGGMQSLTGKTVQPGGPDTRIVKVAAWQVGESLFRMVPSKSASPPGEVICAEGTALRPGGLCV